MSYAASLTVGRVSQVDGTNIKANGYDAGDPEEKCHLEYVEIGTLRVGCLT